MWSFAHGYYNNGMGGEISIQLLLLFIGICVAVVATFFLFQYNSCYCLSFVHAFFFANTFRFQYNSCYCLSLLILVLPQPLNDFNTTLVTVYRDKQKRQSPFIQISIQLLLLFIGQDVYFDIQVEKFQYNSCYCLS